MDKRKQLVFYKPKTYWWKTAGKRSVAQLRAHPLRFGFRFLIIGMFLCLICVQMATTGRPDVLWVTCGCLFVALTLMRLLSPISVKGEQVHQWAVEEQEHQVMASLTGKTTDELEKMLEYHMKYGHLEEADRISQKLLTMVDKEDASNQAPAEPATRQDAKPKSGGLPAWMQDGTAADTTIETPQEEKKKLPDWMN
jgi:hypothetical protein